MKIVLTPIAEKKSGAPGHTHCPYCNQYVKANLMSGVMCMSCRRRNDQQATNEIFTEGFAAIHEKLDRVLAGGKKPAKAKPVKAELADIEPSAPAKEAK